MEVLSAVEERTLSDKLKLMTNFDSDQQFIAACDLSDFVEKHSQRIPEATLARIIDALLDHLKSEIIDVHGNAIKCLSKVISKLPVQQSKRISEVMVKNVTASTVNSDLRDVYGTCMKTIINDVPQGFGEQIKQLLKQTVDVLIEPNRKQPPNVKIEEELVDIAGSFMKKWPRMISRVDIKKFRFAEYLYGNVVTRDDSVLRKRSIMCAGILAASLNKQELHDLLFGKGVIGYLSADRKTDRQGIERRRFALQLLSNILKAQNPAVQDDGSKLLEFLQQQALWLKKGGEDAKIDKADEMLECTLQALQYLLKGIKKDIAAGIVHDSITKLALELTQYSPHTLLEYVSVGMEEEEDEYQDESTDDYSERVRRAALQLLAVLSGLSPSLCNHVILNQEIYLPLCEKNESVVETTFAVLTEVLGTLAHFGKDIPSQNISKIIENIHKQLSGLLQCGHSFDLKIYSGAAQLICEVARKLPNKLSADSDLLKRYIELAGGSLHKAKSNEAKISLLNFMEIVGGEHSFLNYRPVLAVLLGMTDNAFYKVSLAALRAIYTLIEHSHNSINRDDSQYRQLVELLQIRAKKSDADQEIKHVTTGCVASLLAHCTDKLFQPEIQEFVRILLGKVSTEVEKRHILSAICRISKKLQVTAPLVETLNGIVKVVANNCLPMADQSIKSKAAEALENCLTLLGNNLTEENALVILNNSKNVLLEGTLAAYFDRLCKLYPDLLYPSISKLILMRVPPSSTIKALYNCKSANRKDILKSILAQLRSENLQTTIKLLGELEVGVADLPIDQNESQILVALKIGIQGAHGDLKNFRTFVEIVQSDDQTDSIKYQASIGLGLILRSHPNHLEDLLKELETKEKYMMLVAVREYIRGSNHLNQSHLILLPRLFKECGYENQSILNIISECVGLIASLDLPQTQSLVVVHAKNEQTNKRFVFANSCRYLFTREAVKVASGLDIYIQSLVGLVRDEDLQVKSAVMKSLNIIAYHDPHALKTYANDRTFLEGLAESLAFDPNMVEQVQMGSVVERIDRGKPLRLDAFSLLDTLLKKILKADDCILHIIVSSALRTYETDMSVEVQIRRLLIVSSLLTSHPSLVHEFSKELAAKLSLENQQWKDYNVKKPNEPENAEKLLGEMLDVVRLLYAAREQLPNNDAINHLYIGLRKVPRFALQLDALESTNKQ